MSEKYEMLVIVGMMRTGSNLLERLLGQHPQISVYGEIFNQYYISRPNWTEVGLINLQNRKERFEELLEFFKMRCEPNLPIFRLFNDHAPFAIERVIRDRKIAKVILERDPFDSYISLLSARKTEQWRLSRLEIPKSEMLHFNLSDYQEFEHHQSAFYRDTKNLLNITDQQYISINYTEIKQIVTLKKITDFAGLTIAKDYYFQNTDKQQSDNKLNLIENIEDVPKNIRQQSRPTIEENLGNGFALKNAYISNKLNLAFVPILGTGENYEIEKLEKITGETLDVICTNDLNDWQAESEDKVVYTQVIHPAKRLYLLTLLHIFGKFDGFSGNFLECYTQYFNKVTCALPLPSDPTELAKQKLAPFEYKRFMKDFGRLLRNELYGFPERISSDEMWSQDLLIQNLNQKIRTVVKIESEYPNLPAFDPLREAPEPKNTELWEPVRARRFIYSGTEHILRECYREDYQNFGFELIGKN